MRKFLLVGATALTVMLCSAPGAAAVEATVRVEGASATLVPATLVTVPTVAPKPNGTDACAAGSAGAALWEATGGSWSGTHFSFGYAVETIKGESHVFPDPDYWEFWRNGKSAPAGACDTQVQPGDQILFIVQRCEMDASYNCTNPPVLPLLAASSTATPAPGAPFTVTVETQAKDGTKTPTAGATVAGGGASATTGADGKAQLTLAAGGPVTLAVTKPGSVRNVVSVCATTGSDGLCGTTSPGPAPAPTEPVAPCESFGETGLCGTQDRTAPDTRITGPQEGGRYRRGSAPREVGGRVVNPEPLGIRSVQMRITRRDGNRCTYYSARVERWVRASRCGAVNGRWFKIAAEPVWKYLLPSALGRGRYVLDFQVTDNAGNVTTLARTRTRNVFHVR